MAKVLLIRPSSPLRHFDESRLEQKIKETECDLVGIGSMTATVNFADRIAGIIKSVDPEIVTILGGYHADAIPFKAKSEFKTCQ